MQTMAEIAHIIVSSFRTSTTLVRVEKNNPPRKTNSLVSMGQHLWTDALGHPGIQWISRIHVEINGAPSVMAMSH